MVGKFIEEGIEERAPGVYRIWVSAGRNPVTGKRQRITRTVHGTLEDARLEKRRLEEKVENRSVGMAPSRMTVAEWLDRWMEQNILLGRWRPSTVHAYRKLVKNMILPHLGHARLRDLEPHHVQTWIVDLVREGYSPRTVVMAKDLLGASMKAAERQRLIVRNPVHAIEIPRCAPEGEDRKVLTQEEADKLLSALRETRYYTLIFVALNTGMRIGELLALKWSDWDEKEGALHVRRTIVWDGEAKKWKIQNDTKSKAGRRIVYLDQPTVAALKRHRVEQAKQRLKLGSRWHDLGLIFPKSDGGIQNPDHVRLALKKACRRAGLRHVHPHMLRHTHISWLIAQGWPPKEVANRVGQASLDVTDTYTHPIPGLQKLLIQQGALMGPMASGTKVAPEQLTSSEEPLA